MDSSLLAARLEAESSLRERARKMAQLTMWPSPATTGIPSQKACVLNCKCLEVIAGWWVQKSEGPHAIPINLIREEAGFGKNQNRNCSNGLVLSSRWWFNLKPCSVHPINFQPKCPSTKIRQVAEWRTLMGLPEDPPVTNLDSWGLKRLFSHLLRRWMSGAERPRDLWLSLGNFWLKFLNLLKLKKMLTQNPTAKRSVFILRTMLYTQCGTSWISLGVMQPVNRTL